MDVVQCEKEQNYFNQKRWLLNRLVVGSGVVCGLDVTLHERGVIRIQPGVAIDGLGREILVPEARLVNPRQLTDERGHPTGKPINEGNVNICLAYTERKTDPVPAPVRDCDIPGDCAPNTIREEFCILVRHAKGHPPEPPTHRLGKFPLPIGRMHVGRQLHELLCTRINASDPEAVPVDPCVHLARTIIKPRGGIDIHAHTGRRLTYDNALLYEIILCLAERVQELSERIGRE
jgi:hypothetical protein